MNSSRKSTLTNKQQKQLQLIRKLSSHAGATPQKLSRFEADGSLREVFNVDSSRQLIVKLLAAIQILSRVNPIHAQLASAVLDLEQVSQETSLLRRSYKVGEIYGISPRSTDRHVVKALTQVVRFIDVTDTASTQSHDNEQTALQRIDTLEKLLRGLLRSRHVAESTKDMIRQYVI